MTTSSCFLRPSVLNGVWLNLWGWVQCLRCRLLWQGCLALCCCLPMSLCLSHALPLPSAVWSGFASDWGILKSWNLKWKCPCCEKLWNLCIVFRVMKKIRISEEIGCLMFQVRKWEEPIGQNVCSRTSVVFTYILVQPKSGGSWL